MKAVARFLSSAAILGIQGYRQHVSPHKGFSCAYRVYGRGASCSVFAERVLGRGCGLKAIPIIRRRLIICRSVHHAEMRHMSVGARWQGQRGDCDLPFFDCGDVFHVFDSDLMKGKALLLRGCIDGGDCLSGIFDLWPKKKDKRRATVKALPRQLRRRNSHQAGFCDEAVVLFVWLLFDVIINGCIHGFSSCSGASAKEKHRHSGDNASDADVAQGSQPPDTQKNQ